MFILDGNGTNSVTINNTNSISLSNTLINLKQSSTNVAYIDQYGNYRQGSFLSNFGDGPFAYESMVSFHNVDKGDDARNEWWLVSYGDATPTFYAQTAYQVYADASGSYASFTSRSKSGGVNYYGSFGVGPTYSMNIEMKGGATTDMLLSPLIPDGELPYQLGTDVTHSSGNLLAVQNNATNKFIVSFDGKISTAAPTGGTAGAWKLGTVSAGTITPDKLIEVEIGGTVYQIPALIKP